MLVSYAAALDFEHVVMVVKDCMKHIINETLSSKYLPIKTQATCTQYIRLVNLCINDISFLQLLERLGKGGEMCRNLRILHLYWSFLHML